jgi:hypothetical protein
MRRLVRVFVCAALLAVATVVAAPSAVSAAAGCWGNGCEGELAANFGCQDDAYVVASVTVPAVQAPNRAEMDLWYSPACHAVWGEYYTTYSPDSRDIGLYSSDSYGSVEHNVRVAVIGQGDYRTTMTGWDGSVKACAEHNFVDPDLDLANDPNWNLCTRWR